MCSTDRCKRPWTTFFLVAAIASCSAPEEDADSVKERSAALTTQWVQTWNTEDPGVAGVCQTAAECSAYIAQTCTGTAKWRLNPGPSCGSPWPNGCFDADTSKNVLYFHGQNVGGGPTPDGVALYSKDKFNRFGYISAETEVKPYCGPQRASGCFFSINLYNGETNYRGLALETAADSTTLLATRYAPCNTTVLTTPGAQDIWHRVRVDYYGQDGGKWVYFVDDVVRKIEDVSASNTGSILQADPGVAVLFVGKKLGSYIEGQVKPIRVWTGDNVTQSQLSRLDGIGVTSRIHLAQEIRGPGTNPTRIRLFFGRSSQTAEVAAYTDNAGRPGTLINTVLYQSNRSGPQDVPFWVPGSYSRIWLVVKGVSTAVVDIGTSSLAANPYVGTLLRSDNAGATWSTTTGDLFFQLYTR